MIADPALVLVDFQNEFCKESRDGAFVDDPAYQPAVESTAAFLERYRASGRTPVYVRAVHGEDTLSREWGRRYERRGRMSARAGTPEAEIVPELAPDPDDPVVAKHRYDGFYATDLDLHLSTNDVSHVLLAGTRTNVCVESTARSAYDRDYRVTVLADCVASDEADRHEAALDNLGAHFGEVAESDAVALPPVADASAAE